MIYLDSFNLEMIFEQISETNIYDNFFLIQISISLIFLPMMIKYLELSQKLFLKCLIQIFVIIGTVEIRDIRDK